MSVSAPGEPAAREAQRLARAGLLTFAGAAVSAGMGLVLTVVLARGLGDSGSGVVLQAIGILAIATAVTKSGMDSVGVWLMPRLASEAIEVRGALALMGVTALTTSALGALAVLGALTWSGVDGEVAETLRGLMWALPASALLLVALAATRGLGGVVPYVVVGSIGLPAVRPLVVGLVVAAGGGAALAAVGWAAPLPVALAVAILVLRSQVLRVERLAGARGSWRPTPERRRAALAFAWPRTISAVLEQGLLWLDILIVGAVAGSAAAGVYGAAGRLIMAGLIVDTALRVVVSPRISALLHEGRTQQVQELYRVAASWLVLFSTPVYLLLAVFGPVVMSWLGPDFADGAGVLVVLSVGATVALCAGNIHTVLLMSGHSGWAAINKAVVLGLYVVGNVVLVPHAGILGAAAVWAASMVVDAGLAAVEVRRLVGITVELRRVGYALAVAVVTVGAPAVAARVLWGPSPVALVVAAAVGATLLVGWCVLDRRRLHLADLGLLARRSSAR